MTRKRILSKVDDLAADIMARMNKSIQRSVSLKETAATALKMLRIELVKGLEANSSDSHQKYLQDIYFDIVTRWRSELRDIDFRANQLEQTMQEKIFPVKLFGELSMRHRADGQPEKSGSYSDTLVGLSENCVTMRKAKSKSDHCGVDGDGHAHRKKSHRKAAAHDMSAKLDEDAQVMTLRKKNRRHRQSSSRNSKLRFPKVNQGLHSNLVGVRSPSSPNSPKPSSPWQGVFIDSPDGDNESIARPHDLTTGYMSTRRESEIKERPPTQNGDNIGSLHTSPQHDAGDGINTGENVEEPTWATTKDALEYSEDINCTPVHEPEASEDDGGQISKSQEEGLCNSDSALKFDDSDSVILKKSSVTTILMSDEDETVEYVDNCVEDKIES